MGAAAAPAEPPYKKRQGFPRRFIGNAVKINAAATLPGCDWLACDSAQTAIDSRVDSALLLAASSLVSARAIAHGHCANSRREWAISRYNYGGAW
jgi:hypothetical protein